jgi:AraC family L-rhamnose operon transcriptional activator RhaR/AraC family L-rhamnose operon regulatory protein RhaS
MYLLDSRKYWSDAHLPIQFEFRNPQSPFPLHIHDFHEIALIYSGKAVHLTVNGDADVQSGDIISIKPGQAHGYKNIHNLVLMNILMRPSFFEEDRFGIVTLPAWEALFEQDAGKDIEKTAVTHFRLQYGPFLRAKNLIESAHAELTGRPDGYRAVVTSLMQEFIVLLIRNYRDSGCGHPAFASDVGTLVNYIKDNYHSSLNMKDLTCISGMSASRILRIFKRHFGCAPFQYINRLRLQAAEDALIQTDKPITGIALDLGFNDSNYFTRLFRKHLELSPHEYRNRYLKENLL